ncbi:MULTISPECIES: alkaline phosphatase family protein [unclassified Tenacibaculum]|uniref:alkaline phosphatase family protein n=1 Tax=unclassified Tenacibaculum TaxID=2635139 RepID=UPI001F229319|nr:MULTISPECIES: alkaline phosphatase family protein [unclassified Tenacibaculum]MCF2876525.1 alkaline phosphatase family protein [Tenacibaculum sp. Cn5-1]MCF2936568.1 alkaline phosphatase family protein [Tenacibaculum sp. Cn5-34]MCG7511839.1 alkaline phosphatase family protein [Tenacibaculum sp. Cn5-46]
MRRDVLSLVFFLFHSIVNANRIYKDSIVKKVVFVIVDGISTDQLKSSKTPYLDSISLQGSYTDAYVGGGKGTYSETPTISAVGYNSLLTGTWANKHNVWGNSIKLPNYNYPTIFKLFKDKRPKGTIGVFSSWLDNRTKLVGDGLKATNFIKVDYAFDGLENDTINFPHDKRRNFMKLIDYTVADYTAKTIVEKGPDISWVYLEFSDDIGHRYGDSKRFEAAVSFEDKLVGKIWNAIKKREKLNNEEWLLIVTTDHGRNKKEGKDHGGQSRRERSTWIVTNTKKTNFYFKNYIPAIVDIFPTITDFLNLEIPDNIRRELDGVSLINLVDVINLEAKKEKDSFLITWKSLVKKGKAKLYFSTYNEAKYGGIDKYEYITSVSLEEEQVRIPIKRIPNGFGKIVLETSNTILNTWLVKLKKP